MHLNVNKDCLNLNNTIIIDNKSNTSTLTTVVEYSLGGEFIIEQQHPLHFT